MKKINLIFFAIIFILLSNNLTNAQDPSLEWVKSMGNSNQTRSSDIAADAFGNVYITGNFIGTMDFDPGPEEYNLTSTAGYDNFIQKLDAEGNLLWVKLLGLSDSNPIGYKLTVDDVGNVYLTGDFFGTVDFYPGPGVFYLTTSIFAVDSFVLKLDEEGQFLYAKHLKGDEFCTSNSIAVDELGNVYVAGFFTGTVDFDPGVEVFNLSSAGQSDIFIQKLDVLGNLTWANAMSGPEVCFNRSLVVDHQGNIYSTGQFRGTVEFDPGNSSLIFESFGEYDLYVQKLNTDGVLMWAKQIGGLGDDTNNSIAIDEEGNTYITGSFSSTVDFDPGIDVLNLNPIGITDIFVQKLDVMGKLVWVKQTGSIDGSLTDEAIKIDVLGDIYVLGSFNGTNDFDFDPGLDSKILTSFGFEDIFIQKLDDAGNFIWAGQIGGADYDYPRALAVNTSGGALITGNFSGNADFDPGAGTFEIDNAEDSDIFIVKLSDLTIDTDELEKYLGIQIYPNPAKNSLHFQSETKIDHIRISNILGQQILEINDAENIGEIDLKCLPSGNYVITFLSKDQLWSTEFIKQ